MRRSIFLVVLGVTLLGAAVAPAVERADRAPDPNQPPMTQKQLDALEEPVGGDATWPGPDGFGYVGVDCTYSWIDITGTGTLTDPLGDDDWVGPYPVGFDFPFYGVVQTDFYVGSNGFISFGAGSTSLSNQCPLPSSSTPDNLIALLWDDLDPGDTSDPVYYQSFGAGTCPFGGYAGACLVVLYDDFCHYPGGATCASAGTWEAILFDDTSVVIQFLDAGAETGSSSTTGIEGSDAAADHGLFYACNVAGSITSNTCLMFAPPQPGLYMDPGTMTVSGCNGITEFDVFDVWNNTGADGTFTVGCSVTAGPGVVNCPASIFIPDGGRETLTVELEPDICATAGEMIDVTVDISGNSYSDQSTISKTVLNGIGSWQRVADIPEGTRYHATAYHNDFVYRFGGETGWWVGTDTAYRYEIGTDTWSAIASLPGILYGMDAVTLGDSIYLAGGSSSAVDPFGGTPPYAFSSDLLIYDTATDSYSTDATDPLPEALAYAQVVEDSGLIYVIGGLRTDGTASNALYIYDPAAAAGSRWTAGAPMAEARAIASAGVIDGKIYVAGGFAGGALALQTMEIYDITAGTWSAGAALSKPWAPWGDAVVGGRYFAIFTGDNWDASTGSSTITCAQDIDYFDVTDSTWYEGPDYSRCTYGGEGVSNGTTIYQVSGRTNEGTWHMAVEVEKLDFCPDCQAPVNDECSGALVLTPGTCVTVTNDLATDSGPPNPSCANYQGGDVWVALTLADGRWVDQVYTDSAGSPVTDTGMAYYAECPHVTEIDCDDDGGTSLYSQVGPVNGPGTYYFRVWEYGNNSFGEFLVCASDEVPVELSTFEIE